MADNQVTRRAHNFQDLTGQVFSKLTVIRHIGTSKQKAIWLCRCECGNETQAAATHLRSGHTQSCGCHQKQRARDTVYKHGRTGSPIFNVWVVMKARCLNPKDKSFPRYGGRGITICQRWMESFQNFLTDMGERPSSNHSLERVNNNGNYEPGNCCWALPDQQNNNKRSNRLLTYNGKTQSMALWCRETGINYRTLQDRLVNGWSDEKALTFPVRH